MGNQTWITPSVKQWWCTSSIMMCLMGQGLTLGHTAYLLPALLAHDSPIKVDIGQATWIASIPGAAIFGGASASCLCMNWLGRRASFFMSIIPGIIGWTMIYLAESYLVLLVARFILGLTAGAVCNVAVVVIGEYTSPQNRGMFLNLKTTAVCLGSTLSHILGNIMHWRTIAIVALIPHVIALAITLSWPESPSWLASRKKYDECEKEFFWLRGECEESAREVTELIESQKERFSHPKKETSAVIKFFLKKFTMKDFLKPLFINTVAVAVMEGSGRHYFPSYALQIMNDVIHSKSSAYYYTICIDIVVLASTMSSVVLIRMMKVRTLLFSSGIGSLVILVFLCTYLFLTSLGAIPSYPWIIVCLFITYFAVVNIGCATIPFALQGELFPLAHKESGMFIAGLFFSSIHTGTLKATPYLLLALNVYGTLAVYGIIIAVALLILYFTLPETKNKTLQEIENFFKYGRYRIDNDPENLYSKMLIKDHDTS